MLRSITVAALVGATFACSPPAPAPTRTVVLISIDTLRPERLGVYGNTSDVSPTLDALARDSVVFDSALACAPWTLPSHATLFTGLDPFAHGVVDPLKRLPESALTLAERLGEAGFDTAAFTGGGFCGTGWGFEQGFDVFDAAPDGPAEQHGFARFLDRALEWMRARGDRPYFLFLHTFDVHAPYDVGDEEVLREFRARPTSDGPDDWMLHRNSFTRYARDMRLDRYGRMAEVLNDYDAGVHEADRGVDRVLAELRSSGRYDDALIVVLSDHGESFYDHGLWIGHGLELTDDELRVPLIAKLPRAESAGTRRAELVDLADVAPTILDAAGLGERIAEAPAMQGSSLIALVRGEPRSRDFVVGGTYTTRSSFLVRDGLKYVSEIGITPYGVALEHLGPSLPPELRERIATSDEDPGASAKSEYSAAADPLGLLDAFALRAQLFDRRADPRELHDLADARPSDVERMRNALEVRRASSQRVAEHLGTVERKLDENDTRGLQALGYAVGGASELDEREQQTLAALRRKPPVAPCADEALTNADRELQRLRVRMRDAHALGAEELTALTAAADGAVAWLQRCGQPKFQFRALWSVLQAQELARAAGASFDARPFEARIAEVLAHPHAARERKSRDGAPAEPRRAKPGDAQPKSTPSSSPPSDG